jgi:ATP synthase protein I
VSTPGPNGDDFVREVGKQADRRKANRGRSVWQGISQVGTVGWMVVLPAVGGAFLGRWVDARYATGIFWTLSLLTAGLVVGCAAAWRAMNRELHS